MPCFRVLLLRVPCATISHWWRLRKCKKMRASKSSARKIFTFTSTFQRFWVKLAFYFLKIALPRCFPVSIKCFYCQKKLGLTLQICFQFLLFFYFFTLFFEVLDLQMFIFNYTEGFSSQSPNMSRPGTLHNDSGQLVLR